MKRTTLHEAIHQSALAALTREEIKHVRADTVHRAYSVPIPRKGSAGDLSFTESNLKT